MATKKEILEEATALTVKHNTPAAFNTALLELLAVKTGGGSFNIDDVAVLDGEGKPVFILDSIFNKWVPVLDHAGKDVFYVKPDTTLGYSRWARVSESTRKAAEKVFKATKDAVFKDLMGGKIDQPAAQKLMDTAETAKKNLVVPAELCAVDEKPAAGTIKAVQAKMKQVADANAKAVAEAKAKEEAESKDSE